MVCFYKSPECSQGAELPFCVCRGMYCKSLCGCTVGLLPAHNDINPYWNRQCIIPWPCLHDIPVKFASNATCPDSCLPTLYCLCSLTHFIQTTASQHQWLLLATELAIQFGSGILYCYNSSSNSAIAELCC